MAFLEAGSADNKQHLNLSTTAIQVMENDMLCFNTPSRSRFLNQVFSNYVYDAEASISFSLTREKARLEEALTRLPEGARTASVKALLDKHRERLEQVNKTCPKYEGFKFRINQSNFEYLTADHSECREDMYYPRIGPYFKAVIEEYSRKPYLDREEIYHKDYFEKIRKAIENAMLLKVQVSNRDLYYVYPYKIVPSLGTAYNYLIGYTIPVKPGDSDLHKRSASLRISNLLKCQVVLSKSGRLTAAEKQALDEGLKEKGPQFMTNESESIRVFLTPAGKEKFKNQLHLRPPCISVIDDSVYEFQCTEIQIEYYFIKFGKDARIISPPHLADRFGQIYTEALEGYSRKNTI